MKKIFLSIILVTSLIIANVGYAEEPTGWIPKWKVGDWWIVVIEYDSSAYSPRSGTVPKKMERVELKFSVVSEEILDGEEVYKIEMRAATKAPYSPTGYDLYILKQNLATRKLVIYDFDFVKRWELLIDKSSIATFVSDVSGGEFNLYALPIFPLKREYNERQDETSFRVSHLSSDYRQFPKRLVQQKTEIINGDILKIDGKVKKEYLADKIYKITFEKKCTEYWSEKVPWYVYFKEGAVKGYLQEYHSN